MLDECSATATAAGYAPRAPFLERTRGMLTAEGSQLTASMFRDIKAGAQVEADHVIGDLIARGDAAKVPVPKLRVRLHASEGVCETAGIDSHNCV